MDDEVAEEPNSDSPLEAEVPPEKVVSPPSKEKPSILVDVVNVLTVGEYPWGREL